MEDKKRKKKNKNSISSDRSLKRITQKTSFEIIEAYKTVRTNLLFSLAASNGRTVVITSSRPAEGKSTFCANLALTLAQTSAKVLIIDGDLRKATQHILFKLDNSKGLSRLLVGLESLSDSIKRSVEPNLDIITSGPNPPNPSELLGSNNMKVLIEKLSEHYDYILIDSPPVNVVTDSVILAAQAAGTLIVSRQRQTTKEDLQKAIEALQFAKANIFGLILTDVKDGGLSYSKYGRNKYGYGYGYGYGYRRSASGGYDKAVYEKSN